MIILHIHLLLPIKGSLVFHLNHIKSSVRKLIRDLPEMFFFAVLFSCSFLWFFQYFVPYPVPLMMFYQYANLLMFSMILVCFLCNDSIQHRRKRNIPIKTEKTHTVNKLKKLPSWFRIYVWHKKVLVLRETCVICTVCYESYQGWHFKNCCWNLFLDFC